MTKTRRWVCPHCGAGALAPSRPRRDDVRRYCLACSAFTGRLVERTCPAAEAERAARTVRAQERTKARTAAVRATAIERASVAGVDLYAEADRLWRLPFARSHPWWGKRVPTLEVRRSTTKPHTSGTCYGSGSGARIVLTVGTDPHDALATLAHELTHALLPPGVHHGVPFWTTHQALARAAWPAAPFRFNEPANTGWQRQRQITDGLRHADQRKDR